MQAAYTCSRSDVHRRNLYNNHSGVAEHGDAVLQKITTDLNNSFVLVFPRWVWRFLYGIFLSPIGYLLRKGKGRIVLDPSSPVLTGKDSGALNSFLDKRNTVEVPRTYYGTAQLRHWTHIWNLRISHPHVEILLYKDDINAAFHRCRYHPDIAIAYAYVWGGWLIIPIGIIFGGRNSPGWFCILSELRAFLATHSTAVSDIPLHPLVTRIAIPPRPCAQIEAEFAPAQADALNPGTGPAELALTNHSTFVDDNLMAEVHTRITHSIQRSVGACYLLFGHPNPLLRTPSLSEEKFVKAAAWRMEQLGLDVDTRLMRIIYPLLKREDFLRVIDTGWAPGSSHTTKEIAHLLGHARTASVILPLGSYFSIRLQQWLNHCIVTLTDGFSDNASQANRTKAAWRSRRGFTTPNDIAHDVSLLRSFLVSAIADRIWSRPIGLLIPRSPHMVSLTDASYEGLGGYSTAFNFKWRLSSADLESAGLTVHLTEPNRYAQPIRNNLHINVLEFLAVFINTWIAIKILSGKTAPPGGWVLYFLADNTSALGWMVHASRTRRPVVQSICRAYAALLTFVCPSTFAINPDHIAGLDNIGADALSRPLQFPTWSAADKACPALGQLQAYQIPFELLLHLHWIVSEPLTGDRLEPATVKLLSLALNTLSTGGHRRDSATSLLSTQHPRKQGKSSRRTRKR